MEGEYDTFESILGHWVRKGILIAQVKLETDHEFFYITLQPFMEMCDDVPDLVQKWVANIGDNKAKPVYNELRDEYESHGQRKWSSLIIQLMSACNEAQIRFEFRIVTPDYLSLVRILI